MAIGDGVQQAYKSAIGIAEETTWGTFKTATAFIEFTGEGFNGELEAKRLDEINSQRTPSKRVQGNKSVMGSLETTLKPGEDAMVLLLKQLMGGTVTSSGTSTTGYIHVLNVGDQQSNAGTNTSSNVLGLTAQVRKGGDHVFNFLGMKVNQATISGEVGEPVKISLELIGKDFTSASALSTTVSYTTTLPVNFTGITIYNADSIGAITTTATETYNSFSLQINNNLVNDIRQLGSRLLSALPVATQDVSMTLGQRFDTTTAYSRWTGETVRAFEILLDTGNTVSSTSGATTYSMRIKLPRCYHDGSTIPQIGSRNDVLSQELQLTCFYDSSAGYAVQTTVVNLTASYY